MVLMGRTKIELEKPALTILIKKAWAPVNKMPKRNLLHLRVPVRQIPNKTPNDPPTKSNQPVIA
jgi:hypothetical protein